ncbi:hypothetical protein MTR_1g095390 [Medicago truncatula]|uniref:Uncharacterized protein n=1 Tax=Medicago truncatula TaxID=3880 RepID=A0A072VND9_MEDTR|nr:hypothetical protein MTR_1g095390 [Medicago truncatula]
MSSEGHTYIVQQSSHGIVIFKVTGLCFLTAEQRKAREKRKKGEVTVKKKCW